MLPQRLNSFLLSSDKLSEHQTSWGRRLPPPPSITAPNQTLSESSPCVLLSRETRGALGVLCTGHIRLFTALPSTNDVTADKIIFVKALHKLENGHEERKNLINRYRSGGIDPGLMLDRRKGPGSCWYSIRCEGKEGRRLLRIPRN